MEQDYEWTALEAEVIEILQRQGKIAAIKYYREETGQGLKEAKEAVEELQILAGVDVGHSATSGCASVFLFFAALAYGVFTFVTSLFI